MNSVRLLAILLLAVTPYSDVLGEIEVEVLEFALHGTETSDAAISSALDNGSIAGATRWVTTVKEDKFLLGKMSPVRAVKEIDTDGTVVEWSDHEVGTRCTGNVIATDADGFFKISGEYEFRGIIGYKLFKIIEGRDTSVAQPLFRTMRKRFDLVMELGEWYVFTSQPDAGVAPTVGRPVVAAAAESATIRVMALQLLER